MWDGHESRVLAFDEARASLTTVLISATDAPAMQARIDDAEPSAGRPGESSHGG